MSGHEPVNVDQARRLYDRLGTWPAVARVIKRKNGGRYQPQSIVRAVRNDDRRDVSNSGKVHPVLRFACEVAPLLDVAPLRGKNLACFCQLDQPCHADVLLELANA